MAELSSRCRPISDCSVCSIAAVKAAPVIAGVRVAQLSPRSGAATSGLSSLQWHQSAFSRLSRSSRCLSIVVGTMPVISMAVKPSIQFIRGIEEQTVPDVKLTRSRDGSSGVATFTFDQPSVFDSSRELGEITGIYMVDEEGILSSVDVSAKFVNGKPAKIEAKYVMRNAREWDRYMRFMERYAEVNNLGFVKS